MNNFIFVKNIVMKYLFIIITFFFLAGCSDMAKNVDNSKKLSTDLVINNKTSDSALNNEIGSPEFSFDREEHDFGTLIDGEKVSYSFKFTNSGTAPLIISNAKGSCGCTVPNWPKDPISPGESGFIDVTFDSSGRSGKQTKTITLLANTNPAAKYIKITSEIISK